jgi:hypothetical protein
MEAGARAAAAEMGGYALEPEPGPIHLWCCESYNLLPILTHAGGRMLADRFNNQIAVC